LELSTCMGGQNEEGSSYLVGLNMFDERSRILILVEG